MTILLLPVVAVYAWWATALRPFTWPSTVAVIGAGVAAMGFARVRAPYACADTRKASGAGLWLALAVVLAAWQLASYLQHPRADHPTLSSLTNVALETHAARTAAFAGWIIGAARLARQR